MVKKTRKLPSSKEILYRCDSGFFENTLVSLLEEGWSRKFKDSDNIFITYETLPDKFSKDYPSESDLVIKRKIIKYKELKENYKLQFNREYSPQIEKRRSDFQFALLEKEGERRGAWGNYLSTMSYIRAVEKQEKREKEEKEVYSREGSKSVEELKKKWKKEDSGHMLIIG